MQTPWPITADTLAGELDLLAKIVDRWKTRFGDEAWCQQLDTLPEHERDQVFAQLSNELKVVASKSATIVEVLQ